MKNSKNINIFKLVPIKTKKPFMLQIMSKSRFAVASRQPGLLLTPSQLSTDVQRPLPQFSSAFNHHFLPTCHKSRQNSLLSMQDWNITPFSLHLPCFWMVSVQPSKPHTFNEVYPRRLLCASFSFGWGVGAACFVVTLANEKPEMKYLGRSTYGQKWVSQQAIFPSRGIWMWGR